MLEGNDVPYFLGKLIAPRPTFPADINEAEKLLMQEHVDYWSVFLEQGKIVALGPVADPKGTWGLGIFEVESEAEVRALTANDPIVKAGIGFRYDLFLMPRIILRK
jgi:uncharacterized protein